MAKIFNQTDRNPIGMIVSSMLTLVQFQTINGTGWVLADGSTITGTKYAAITGTSVVPDLRGLHLRGKNNGRVDGNQNPDGEVALGTFQADAYGTHQHNNQARTSYWNGSTMVASQGQAQNGYGTPVPNTGWVGGYSAFDGLTDARGGNETRMKNITVNMFIKVND